MATNRINRKSIYKNITSEFTVEANSTQSFTLNESKMNFSWLSIIAYDENYIRASSMIPRMPNANQDAIMTGYRAGSVYSMPINFTSDYAGTITNNFNVPLKVMIRGVLI